MVRATSLVEVRAVVSWHSEKVNPSLPSSEVATPSSSDTASVPVGVGPKNANDDPTADGDDARRIVKRFRLTVADPIAMQKNPVVPELRSVAAAILRTTAAVSTPIDPIAPREDCVMHSEVSSFQTPTFAENAT